MGRGRWRACGTPVAGALVVVSAMGLTGCGGARQTHGAGTGVEEWQASADGAAVRSPGAPAAGGEPARPEGAPEADGDVVRSATQVPVVGGAAPAEREPWVEALPEALGQVRAVWADDLRRPVTLRVPKDAAEYTAAAGGPPSGAAVTVFGAEGPTVIVAPGTARDRSVRVALLTHELAHVAQRRSGTHGAGSWVLEGSAMWTQLQGADLRRHADTELLRERARSGTLPDALPEDGAFTGGEDSRLAYEQAWTLCRYLEDRFGRGTVMAIARAVAAGRSAEAAVLERTGLTASALHTGWTTWVRGWA